jgi:hypothetical protein
MDLPVGEVNAALERFDKDNQIIRHGYWLCVLFFPEHQSAGTTLNAKSIQALRANEYQMPAEVLVATLTMWNLKDGSSNGSSDGSSDGSSHGSSDDRCNKREEETQNSEYEREKTEPPAADSSLSGASLGGTENPNGATRINPQVRVPPEAAVVALADAFAKRFLKRPTYGLTKDSTEYTNFEKATHQVSRFAAPLRLAVAQVTNQLMDCLAEFWKDSSVSPGHLGNEHTWSVLMPQYRQKIQGK